MPPCRLKRLKRTSLHAVDIQGVHCTFKSFGDSMKSGGVVSNFVISVFIRHLNKKPNGHPDISKSQYFFSNIGENLLADPDEASEYTLSRAFRGSKKARPLYKCDMLFYPILFERHWFVFVVDIKDKLWVFLDSYYAKGDE
jgi:hypothetical protein